MAVRDGDRDAARRGAGRGRAGARSVDDGARRLRQRGARRAARGRRGLRRLRSGRQRLRPALRPGVPGRRDVHRDRVRAAGRALAARQGVARAFVWSRRRTHQGDAHVLRRPRLRGAAAGDDRPGQGDPGDAAGRRPASDPGRAQRVRRRRQRGAHARSAGGSRRRRPPAHLRLRRRGPAGGADRPGAGWLHAASRDALRPAVRQGRRVDGVDARGRRRESLGATQQLLHLRRARAAGQPGAARRRHRPEPHRGVRLCVGVAGQPGGGAQAQRRRGAARPRDREVRRRARARHPDAHPPGARVVPGERLHALRHAQRAEAGVSALPRRQRRLRRRAARGRAVPAVSLRRAGPSHRHDRARRRSVRRRDGDAHRVRAAADAHLRRRGRRSGQPARRHADRDARGRPGAPGRRGSLPGARRRTATPSRRRR